MIFISDYAEGDFARTLDEEREVLFMPLPFTLEQLAEMARTMLRIWRAAAAFVRHTLRRHPASPR